MVNHSWCQKHKSLQGVRVAGTDDHDMENEQHFSLATKINDDPDDVDTGKIRTGNNDNGNENDPESASNPTLTNKDPDGAKDS